MFQNFLTTAYRNILQDKLFSMINIIGLALGFAACLLIFLFVWSETNYDSWVPENDRIFRLESTYVVNGRGPLPTVVVPARTKEAIVADYPHLIEKATHILGQGPSVRRGDQQFNENVNFVDENFLEIFPLTFLQGSAENALPDSRSLAISQSMKEKYFGDGAAVGEVLTLINNGNANDYRITGVYADVSDQTHFTADMLSLIDPEEFEQNAPGVFTSWFFPSAFTYLKLKEGVSPDDLRREFSAFADKHNVVPQVASYANTKPHEYFQPHLINIRDIHLDQRVPNDFKPHGSIFIVYAFSGIAILLLLIASVNFINLATARSLRRAKEVALRKTMGASRTQLIAQFMSEAFLTVTFSTVLALILAHLVLPPFNQMLNLSLSLASIITVEGLIYGVMFIIAAAMISGAYPAFYISQARPGDVLHSNKSGSEGAGLLRTALVTFQFAISIALVSSTIILYFQTSYVSSLNIGYESENRAVLRLPFSQTTDIQGTSIQNELSRVPGIKSVGFSGPIPTDTTGATFAVFSPKVDSTDSVSMAFVSTGYGYFETYGIEPIAGRTFSKDFGTDRIGFDPTDPQPEYEGTIILNQSALAKTGYTSPEEAIGQPLRVTQPNNMSVNATIVGVVPDVHYGDARTATTPMIHYYLPNFVFSVSFEYDPAMLDSIRAEVERIWQQQYPENPINLQFVEELLDAQYDDEYRQGQLLAAFSILTVLVAALGLFGLASFTAARRTKEVGIRKVLGATVTDIVGLFVWNLSKPIFIANLFAWPVAYYYMQNWLSGFIYRIDITLIPFISAGIIVSLFGAITVAARTYKVAKTHPSKALRYQ